MKNWSFILDKAKDKQGLILIVVIENHGSSPGREGFKMVVSEDGYLNGSIGGGLMEQQMVEEARKMIREQDFRIVIKRQEHYPEALDNNSGMICSGGQTLAFFPLSSALILMAEEIADFLMGSEIGLIEYSPSGIKLIKHKKQDEKYKGKVLSDEEWILAEQTGMDDKLYIFGGGHVSLALSRVCAALDFDIELFDDRQELSTFHANDWVQKKRIISYDDVGELVQEGSNSYVVIISFTHKGDEKILGQLLGKKLKYLGMMGSEKKVKKIKSNLMEKGFSADLLSIVNTPIGIPINSQTPEEIAISIAAEMIRVRNS